jgi:hypothetical protein
MMISAFDMNVSIEPVAQQPCVGKSGEPGDGLIHLRRGATIVSTEEES